MLYTVRYHVTTYEGTKTVNAKDDDEAIAKVKRWVWAQHPPAPCYEAYEGEGR